MKVYLIKGFHYLCSSYFTEKALILGLVQFGKQLETFTITVTLVNKCPSLSNCRSAVMCLTLNTNPAM